MTHVTTCNKFPLEAMYCGNATVSSLDCLFVYLFILYPGSIFRGKFKIHLLSHMTQHIKHRLFHTKLYKTEIVLSLIQLVNFVKDMLKVDRTLCT